MDTYLRGHMKVMAPLGTLLGPNSYGEILVVRTCPCPDRFGQVELWTISHDDWRKALERPPQSPFEYDFMPRYDTVARWLSGLRVAGKI